MTTVIRQVSASDEDAQERGDGAGFSSTSTSNRVVRTSTTPNLYHSGLYFSNVTVGNADTIEDSTVLEVKALYSSFGNDIRGDVLAEATDDSNDFTAEADVTDRTRTATAVRWDEDDLSNVTFNSSPEIKAAIQEVIDRGGWASANAMMIFLDGYTDPSYNSAYITSYDSSSSDAPKLTINYTGGGGGAVFVSSRLLLGHGI